jgi:hypothetical protein
MDEVQEKMRSRFDELQDLLHRMSVVETSSRLRFVRDPMGKWTIELAGEAPHIAIKMHSVIELVRDIESNSLYRLTRNGKGQWGFLGDDTGDEGTGPVINKPPFPVD